MLKRALLRTLVGVSAIVASAIVSACSGISDISGPKVVTSEKVATVEVSQTQITIGVGGSVALQALARDADGKMLPGKRTFWSSSDVTIATVSVAGLVTALKTGNVQIAATVDGKSAIASLTVQPRGVASVQITPANPQVLVGGNVQLTARTLDDAGGEVTGRDVAWISSDPDVATVNSSGRVTGVSVGTVTLTAMSEGRSASVGVTVLAVPVSVVQVAPPLDTIVIGQTTQRSATLRDSVGGLLTGRVIAWNSSNLNIATVSSSGVVTGVTAGTATISAVSEGRTGNSQVVVRPRPVSSIIVSPGQFALTAGQSQTLTVQITDASGTLLTGRPVAFQSDNASVAQVNAAGSVTGIAPGTTTITVTSEGKSGTATVAVTASPIATLAVTPPTGNILIGATLKLTAAPRDGNGVLLTGRAVAWTTGAPSVATVATDGTVTGVGIGTAVVFATVEGRVASATIQVRAVAVASVVVSPSVTSMVIGDVVDFSAQARDAAGNVLTGRTVTWSSSDNQLAVVSSTGRVRALAIGIPKISATVDGVTGQSTVTIVVEPVVSLTVTPTTLGMLPAQTAQITATPRGRDGQALTGRTITYSTSNSAAATVSATGVVTAVAVGTANITALSEGLTATVPVTVSPTPVATVSVALALTSIHVGELTQATPTTRDANANVLPGRVVVWTSSNPAVASVSSTGAVTALTVGTTNIIATSEGKTGSATLTTTPALIATVTVAVTNAARFVGETTQATATLRDLNNNVLTGRVVVWTSSNPAAATVSTTGLVTAVGAGTTNIIATSETKVGQTPVTVTLAPVATVTVSVASATLLVGQTTQATAVLRDLNNFVLTSRVVTWSSSNALVAAVSPTGLVTALLPGTATITATSEGRNGGAGVTVSLVPVKTINVSLVTPAFNVGATTQATAVTLDSIGGVLFGRTIAWSSSNSSVATVSAAGLVTAIGPGTANIIAQTESITGQAVATISIAPVSTVSVVLSAPSVILGQTSAATATLRDALNLVVTGRPIVWSSSNPAVATVSSAGVATSVGVGTANIIATSEGKTGQAPLTVSPVPVATIGVTVAPSLFIGATSQASATTFDVNNNVLTGRAVAWSSSNPAAATVSASGVVTGVATGSTNITATSEGKIGASLVTVSIAPVASVAVSLASPSLIAGTATQATAVLRDANNLLLSGRAIVWGTSNAAVATVNSSGLVTAIATGNANITATSETIIGSAALSVSPVPVATVGVSLAASSVFIGATTQATATTFDANSAVLPGRAIAWSSSNSSVATVSVGGLVTGVAVGTANIIATSEGKTGQSQVSITVAPVNSVVVGLGASALVNGQTTQATATLRDVNNFVLTGRTVVWSSTAPSVATVSASGLVSAVGVGSADITATSETKTNFATVSVTAIPVATVSVALQSTSIFIAGTTTATATTRDASSNVLVGRTIVWSSSNPSIASVSSGGLVTGVAAGNANIIATSEGQTGLLQVSVSVAPVNTVTVSLTDPTRLVGQTTQANVVLRDVNNTILTGRNVVWSTENASIATVSASGLVTGIASGTVNIVATSEGQTGLASLSVSPVPVATVNVALQSGSIFVNATTNATATTLDVNSNVLTGRPIVWSSSNGAIATVSAAGVVTGVAAGQANIIATSEGHSGQQQVTVSLAPVNTVDLSLANPSRQVGLTTQGTAVLKDINGFVLSGRTINWSTSDGSVATVSNTGLVTAVNPGTATITATSETKPGTAPFTVTAIPVATVGVVLDAPSIFVAFTTNATGTTRDAGNNVLTGRPITWSSSNTNIATVSPTGVVTGVAPGQANIIATSETIQGMQQITVANAPVSSVSVALNPATVFVAATSTASAIMRDVGNHVLNGRAVTWTSMTPGVATVSAAGIVTGVAVGTAEIKATSEGVDGVATVTVTLAPVNAVAVGLAATSILTGTTTTATDTLRDVNGNILLGRAVSWSSTNQAVATVSQTGIVTAVGVGTTTIRATSETVFGGATLTVTPAPVSSVAVSLNPSTVFVAFTSTGSAVLRDANNNVLTGRTVTWSSDNTSVATVSPTGVVTGVAPGTANIKATAETIEGTAVATVTVAPVNTVVVALASTSIFTGTTTTATDTLKDANNNILTGRAVVWSSTNGLVAMVSQAGVVTAVGAGTANIRATSETKFSEAQITVTPAPVSTIEVSLDAPSIAVSATTQAHAVLKDANANVLTGRAIVWVSDNTSVATVSATGEVTAVGVGTTTIRAQSETKEGSVAITVTAQ